MRVFIRYLSGLHRQLSSLDQNRTVRTKQRTFDALKLLYQRLLYSRIESNNRLKQKVL